MTNEKKKTIRQLSFAIDLSESSEVPDVIHVIPTGTWDHPCYGPMVITPQDITQFVLNFNANIRKGVRITAGHECGPELPAVGWFKELIDKGVDGLWAKVEWTKEGITLLSQKAFKFFSPEFYEIYEDPETRQITENVLVGGALTNSPYFKELKAIVFSEPKIASQFNEKSMTIQELMDKKVADLTAEEKTFMQEQSAELAKSEKDTDKALASQIEKHLTPETTTEPTAEEIEAKAAADKAAADESAAKEAREASERGGTVAISASELSALRDMADKGAKAFAELESLNLDKKVKALIFSENNKEGKLLPKVEQKVFSFMRGLNAEQRVAFAEIINSVDTKFIFNEIGDATAGAGAVNADGKSLLELAKALMSEKASKGLTMKFSDALREVTRKNPDLAKNRDSGLERAKDE